MTAYDIIEKKRYKKELSENEISFMVTGLLNESITRAQFSSFLMAIMLNDMTINETYFLTKAMLNSGSSYHFRTRVCDKHSTGGVSDTTTLLIAPILASLNVNIAKMSGRALGFTGGTADKLEVFPNYNLNLTEKQLKKQLSEIHCAIITQGNDIAVADKIIYKLRDETACVDSIPLIASSILSKKLASGANYILYNVQYGTGAFMKTKKDALKLSHLLVNISKKEGRQAEALISNMDTPLAHGVGCGEEVRSVIDAYNGTNSRLRQLSVTIASYMLAHEKQIKLKKAKSMVLEVLKNGLAKQKFIDLITAQSGNAEYVNNPNSIPKAPITLQFKANENGTIKMIDAYLTSKALSHLKTIQPSDVAMANVGLRVFKNIGDKVNKGDVIAEGYSFVKNKNFAIDMEHAITIKQSWQKISAPKLIYKHSK